MNSSSSYDLTEFETKVPYDTFFRACDGGDFGFFAARWMTDEFEHLLDFIRFCFRFSCVLQPYIAVPERGDLFEFFFPDEQADEHSAKFADTHPSFSLDAERWVLQFFDANPVNWLVSGDHTQSVELRDDPDRPELFAKGRAGYVNVFWGDVL